MHDRRGVGLSDPVHSWEEVTLEARAADALCVLDTAASERSAVVASDMTGNHIAIMLAAMYPKRVSSLVLTNPVPLGLASPDYPWGLDTGSFQELLTAWRHDVEESGSEALDLMIGRDRGDDALREWWSRSVKRGVKPGQIEAAFNIVFKTDTRAVLPSVQATTLILNDDQPPEWHYPHHASYVERRIPDANRLEMPGVHNFVYASAKADSYLATVQEFITGVRPPSDTDRVLATVLFTDIVDSTSVASRLGDSGWAELRARHDEIVRRHMQIFPELVDTAGDGIFATFDGPARAIRCAASLAEELNDIGLAVRAGIHTGEVNVKGTRVTGIAVNISARSRPSLEEERYSHREPSRIWLSDPPSRSRRAACTR